ncbi:hypothetical protein ACCS66_03940 [Rhizobium ruizarguesonis]
MLLNAEKIGLFAAYEWINPLKPLSKCLKDWGDELANDDSFQVSLGDIAATCGSVIALRSLPENIDRRAGISLIYPALKRSTRYTPDMRVRQCLKLIKAWMEEAADLDVQLARSLLPHEKVNSFWFPENGLEFWFGEDRFEIDDTVRRVLNGIDAVSDVFRTVIDYITDEALRDPRHYSNSYFEHDSLVESARNGYHPSSVARLIIELVPAPEVEREAQVDDILAISPLHTLEFSENTLQRKW